MEQDANNIQERRSDVKNIAIVFAVACAARLAYLIGFRHSPFYGFLFLDPKWHYDWAKEVAAGNWLGSGVFFRAPLYPYFLAVIYKLTGAGLTAPRIAQFILGSISSALVYMLGVKSFQNRASAVVAGIIAALYGPMIYFEGELLMPALIVFLNLAALLFLFKARESRGGYFYAASGICFGLSAAVRPDVLAPVAGLWFLVLIENFRESRRKAVKLFFIFFISTMVLPILVTVRNGIVGGDYVFVASQGGVNFYIGNNSGADGKTSETPGNIYLAPTDKYRDSVWVSSVIIAEKSVGKKLKPSEVSAFWYRESFNWIKSNPSKAAALFARKIFYLFSGHEIPCNNVPLFARNYSLMLSLLMWERLISFPTGLIIPLGVLGMALGWPQKKRWAPLYVYVTFYSAAIVAFFVTARYKMPIMPVLILFSIVAARQLYNLYINKRWKPMAAANAALIILIFISNADLFGVRNDYIARPLINAGNYYNDLGKYDLAAEYYGETLKYYPEHYMALENLAILKMKAGEYGDAVDLFARAIKQMPNDPELHNGLGAALEYKGDLRQAELEYQFAVDLDPNYDLAKSNLQRVRAALNNAGQQ